ncbi:MAG: PhnA domain-containing protein [Proteobacteria bacterium]|nr:PhnA domain-containing protein [Pseudomonadota bacterium]
MTVDTELKDRANGQCELCTATESLSTYVLPGANIQGLGASVLLCATCLGATEQPSTVSPNHWRALKDSIWSEHTPVKVLAYRMLKGLKDQPWAQDLLGQIYLDDDALVWADAGDHSTQGDGETLTVVDSNGTQLLEGDTVTLIKDLVVKGANFTAKRGTVVKGINLTDDPKYIEGRVNGTRIVLVAAYLKKA